MDDDRAGAEEHDEPTHEVDGVVRREDREVTIPALHRVEVHQDACLSQVSAMTQHAAFGAPPVPDE